MVVELNAGVTRVYPKQRVVLSGSGLLTRDQRSIQLTRAHATLVALILERSPTPVSAGDLNGVLWPTHAPTHFARNRRLMQIRRELALVGLALRSRAGVGYTLEAALAATRADTPEPTRHDDAPSSRPPSSR